NLFAVHHIAGTNHPFQPRPIVEIDALDRGRLPSPIHDIASPKGYFPSGNPDPIEFSEFDRAPRNARTFISYLPDRATGSRKDAGVQRTAGLIFGSRDGEE